MLQKKIYALPLAASTVLYVREDAPVTDPAPMVDTAKLIADAVAAATTGLKAKNDELLGKLKTSSEKLGAFGTLDPERAKALLESIDHDEDVKLFAEGKKNQVIDKYTERMRTAHGTELEVLKGLVAEETKRADAYRGAVLDNHIRAVTGECHKGAVEDALMLARSIFSLDAKGNPVKLDSEGRPELGKDGKTPFSPSEWMELQREIKPHWFPASASGSGSQGDRSSAGTGRTVKRAAFEAMDGANKSAYVKGGGKIVD